MADFLTLQDLYNKVGEARVQQYFDDDVDGSIADESTQVAEVLNEAEAFAYSYLLNAFSSVDGIIAMAAEDQIFVGHCAWVALEFAVERRPEFTGDDGKGHYWAQYERAKEAFIAMGKGRRRSRAESEAGGNLQQGGAIQPVQTDEDTPRFVFAPDNNSPTGHGGY